MPHRVLYAIGDYTLGPEPSWRTVTPVRTYIRARARIRPTLWRPRLLDLFCGQGGASVGYHRAGFEVVGVDIVAQPDYPFEFHRADARKFSLRGFDVIHASPPCQAWTEAQKIRQNAHPKLVQAIRTRLRWAHVPYVIENALAAPLLNPVMLCGAMFPGLRVYRHRLFESNVPLVTPPHPPHRAKLAKLGRSRKTDEWLHVVGNFSGVDEARVAMGIP